MNTAHETTTKTFKDGFKTVKKWSYVKKNGHSAWDGFVWKANSSVVSPSGIVYFVSRNGELNLSETLELAREIEKYVGQISGKDFSEACKILEAAGAWKLVTTMGGRALVLTAIQEIARLAAKKM